MNFGIPVIDVLSRELDFEGAQDDAQSDDPSQRMIFEKEISVRGISFAYGNGAKSALNDINMSIGFGESIGLIGLVDRERVQWLIRSLDSSNLKR